MKFCFLGFPANQLDRLRLQLILNSAACAVAKTSKFKHVTPKYFRFQIAG
jgi:hypothetical protein